MDKSDDFFLAWLARDARFQASVHFSPKHKLGYAIHRKLYTSMFDEPQLNMWLATKGVHGRILRDKDQIQKVLAILAPVKEAIKDSKNLTRLFISLDCPSARKMKHADICRLIEQFDGIV